MSEQKTPEAPKPTAAPTAAPEAKITLDAKNSWIDLKQKLGVESGVDSAKNKKIAEIEKQLGVEKEKVKTISTKSRDAIKGELDNSKDKIDGKFDVKDGELIFEKKADAEPLKPEEESKKIMKELTQVNMNGVIPDETQTNIAELKTQNKPRWYKFVELLSKLPGIGGFFAGFLGLSEGETPQDIDRDITMIGTILTKTSGNRTLMERLTQGMFTEKKSLISAIRSQPELLRGPNIDPKKLQIYLTHVLQQEPITGGDLYGFLVGQITSYPASDVNLTGGIQTENTQTSSSEVLPAAPLLVPNSPDVLANKLTEAQKADKELADAKKISPQTDESNKKVAESQKKVDAIKNHEKELILGTLSETEKTLTYLTNKADVLKNQKNPVPPELTTEIDAYTTAVQNIKDNILGKTATTDKPAIIAIAERDATTNAYTLKSDVGAEKLLTTSIAIQSIKDKLTPAIATETNKENEKEKKVDTIIQESEKVKATFVQKTTDGDKISETGKRDSEGYVCDNISVLKSGIKKLNEMEGMTDIPTSRKEAFEKAKNELKAVVNYSKAKTALLNFVNAMVLGEKNTSWDQGGPWGDYMVKTDNKGEVGKNYNSGWVVTGSQDNGIWLDIDNTATDKLIMKEGDNKKFDQNYINTLTIDSAPRTKYHILRDIILKNKDKVDESTQEQWW